MNRETDTLTAAESTALEREHAAYAETIEEATREVARWVPFDGTATETLALLAVCREVAEGRRDRDAAYEVERAVSKSCFAYGTDIGRTMLRRLVRDLSVGLTSPAGWIREHKLVATRATVGSLEEHRTRQYPNS